MNGPGIAFAEQVRFVTVASEITSSGFGALGRRAVRAERAADRRNVSEASRHLGELGGRWAALCPDAVGLRALADEVRDNLLVSAEFTALTRLFDTGSLREVTFGLVAALRSAIADVRGMLTPTADSAFDLALAGIDLQLAAVLRAVERAGTTSTATSTGTSTATSTATSRHAVPRPSPHDDESRTSELVRTILVRGRKDFSSPLGVSKSDTEQR